MENPTYATTNARKMRTVMVTAMKAVAAPPKTGLFASSLVLFVLDPVDGTAARSAKVRDPGGSRPATGTNRSSDSEPAKSCCLGMYMVSVWFTGIGGVAKRCSCARCVLGL